MYSEIPVNGKERKVGQALGNQDVGMGEFREMGFTQKGNECLVGITGQVTVP